MFINLFFILQVNELFLKTVFKTGGLAETFTVAQGAWGKCGFILVQISQLDHFKTTSHFHQHKNCSVLLCTFFPISKELRDPEFLSFKYPFNLKRWQVKLNSCAVCIVLKNHGFWRNNCKRSPFLSVEGKILFCIRLMPAICTCCYPNSLPPPCGVRVRLFVAPVFSLAWRGLTEREISGINFLRK